ncbi:MAG: hypothetical protein FWF73_01100, partial [Spirochaetes bacterium]|nr:hypothetical protein [Spirochaetota bacterium]
IGKLAFQTQESIKEINSVISSSSKSTVDGAAVIQKTAQMMREMISQMNQGASKIQILQESLFVEEKFTKIIIGQMKDNITLAQKVSVATDEQKIAIETSFKALEELTASLDGMAIEAKSMARISDEIYHNAEAIITGTKQIAAAEAAMIDDKSEDYEDYEEEA